MLLALLGLSVYYGYHRTVFYPPQSIHAWRQADCASLALNYYKYGMEFFHPRIHLMVSDGGTSGFTAPSEIPVFYYAVAAIYHITGVNESLMRILNLLIFYLGLLYLFRLLQKVIGGLFWPAALTLLFFTSPLLVYYANNYLTNTSALAFAIIGLYHFYEFSTERKKASLWYAALFYLLAGSFKITGLYMMFAILGYLFLGWIRLMPVETVRQGDESKAIVQTFPFIAILMIPKTLAYLGIAIIAFRSLYTGSTVAETLA